MVGFKMNTMQACWTFLFTKDDWNKIKIKMTTATTDLKTIQIARTDIKLLKWSF